MHRRLELFWAATPSSSPGHSLPLSPPPTCSPERRVPSSRTSWPSNTRRVADRIFISLNRRRQPLQPVSISAHVRPFPPFLPLQTPLPTSPSANNPPLRAATTQLIRSAPSLCQTAAVQPFVDETGAPATLPEIGNGGEESKMKVLLGLLRK